MLMASKNRDNCITETTPKMLKEFLHAPNTLPRTRSSRSRAAVTSFQKLITSAMKCLRRGPSTVSLPRSLSTSIFERFSVNNKKNRYTGSSNDNVKVKVKVKDILRWRSSRDLVEEASQPLDFSTERISIATSSDSSNVFRSESSLGEKETCFTADDLPFWWENSCDKAKLWDQDNDVVSTVSHVASKEEQHNNVAMEEDQEQHSPVSVLNSPFREEIDSPFSEEVSDEEEFISSFDKSLANMERSKQRLLESIRSFESLVGVFEDDEEAEIEEVEQEQERRDKVRIIVDNETEMKSREYLSRAIGKMTWKGQGFKDREECIRCMEEEQEQWSKFEEEKRDLGVELQVQVLSDLVNEILIDHFGQGNDKYVSLLHHRV